MLKSIKSMGIASKYHFETCIFGLNSNMPLITYSHFGVINSTEKIPEIDVKFYFIRNDQTTTPLKDIKAIIDTGATCSYISESICPDEITKANKSNKGTAITPMGSMDTILLPNMHIVFPELTSINSPFVYFLPIIQAIDDSKSIKKREEEGKVIYNLLIGADILEKATLIYAGPSNLYKLKFKITC
jgi:hypothetical protein